MRIEKILAIPDENVMANDWPFAVSAISLPNKLFLPHDVFLFGFFPPRFSMVLYFSGIITIAAAAAADTKTLFLYYFSIKSI